MPSGEILFYVVEVRLFKIKIASINVEICIILCMCENSRKNIKEMFMAYS